MKYLTNVEPMKYEKKTNNWWTWSELVRNHKHQEYHILKMCKRFRQTANACWLNSWVFRFRRGSCLYSSELASGPSPPSLSWRRVPRRPRYCWRNLKTFAMICTIFQKKYQCNFFKNWEAQQICKIHKFAIGFVSEFSTISIFRDFDENGITKITNALFETILRNFIELSPQMLQSDKKRYPLFLY